MTILFEPSCLFTLDNTKLSSVLFLYAKATDGFPPMAFFVVSPTTGFYLLKNYSVYGKIFTVTLGLAFS